MPWQLTVSEETPPKLCSARKSADEKAEDNASERKLRLRQKMSIKQWSAKERGDRLQNGKALNAIQNATWATEKKILEKKRHR